MSFCKYISRCGARAVHSGVAVLAPSEGSGRGFGGSIREAGGKFGEMEKAKEDQYFYNLQKDQFKRLKEESKKKLKYHRDQIEKHEKAIRELDEKNKDRQG